MFLLADKEVLVSDLLSWVSKQFRVYGVKTCLVTDYHGSPTLCGLTNSDQTLSVFQEFLSLSDIPKEARCPDCWDLWEQAGETLDSPLGGIILLRSVG